jgi:hypothetical protein
MTFEKRCMVCFRSESQIGSHPLPPIQGSHFLANRFSGLESRYGGAKNPLSDGEWTVLIREIGSDFELSETIDSQEARRAIGSKTIDMCGECHEEVLSEPIYFPAVVRSLVPHFMGKTRVEKMIFLARAIKIGISQMPKAKTDAPLESDAPSSTSA